MKLLSTDSLEFKIARKTKGLRAKPMVTLLVDRAVMAKFLVNTLEAREPVHPDAMFCIGESNDAWQQSAKTLLQKYTVDAIDADGWMVCNPKAENSVEFYQIPASAESGYVQCLWGEAVYGIGSMLQRYEPGDYILRDRGNSHDVWVVNGKIFMNSYTEISSN